MAPRRHDGPAVDVELIVDLVGLTGMTIVETHEYLVARGVDCTLSAVRAWARGSYRPKAEALEALWLIVRAIVDEGEDMPPEAPSSAVRRAEVALGMRLWWAERHPEEIELLEAEERRRRPPPLPAA